MLCIVIQIYQLLHETAFGSREKCFFCNFCPQREDWKEVSNFFENLKEVSRLLISISVYHKNAWSLQQAQTVSEQCNFLTFGVVWMPSIIDRCYTNKLGVVACTCNPATLIAEFWNGVGRILTIFKSPWVNGCIVWTPVIQHKQRNLTKYRDLAEV